MHIRLILFTGILLTGSIFLEPLEAQPVIKGKFQNYNAFKTTGNNQLIIGNNRIRLQVNNNLNRGNIHFNGDINHRYVNHISEIEIILREAYVDFYFERSDFRAGLQSVSFGRSTGIFVTDILTPLDLREFLTRDISDLKTGFIGANYTRYFGQNYLQLIGSPIFIPSRIPESGSRWFPEPSFPDFIPLQYDEQERENTPVNMNVAARFAWRDHAGFDADLMFYYWPHPVPAYGLELDILSDLQSSSVTLRESYLNSPMVGTVISWRPVEKWEILAEALYVHQKLFTYLPVPIDQLEEAIDDPQLALQLIPAFLPNDDGFLTKKPWIHSMAGIRYKSGNWVFSTQAYIEYIFNYEEDILSQKHFPYLAGIAGRSFFRDKLNAILFGQYNIYAEDFWIRFHGNYEWSDNIELSAGINLFGGPDITPFYGHFTFNRYQPNSFFFLQFTAYF